MFKRLGLAGEQKSQPVLAIMFKRLVKGSCREGASVTAIVFKRRVPEPRQKKHRSRPSCSNSPPLPSCSNSPPLPQSTANHAGRFMGPPFSPLRWWSQGTPPNGLGSLLTQLNNDHSEPTPSPIRR